MENFWKRNKVLVTGGTGFVGSRLVYKLVELGCNVYSPSSSEYNLMDSIEVDDGIKWYRPDVVVHLAAKVGGIGANMITPADFFKSNMVMGMNIIDSCSSNKVPKLVLIGTVCSYPKNNPVPFVEESLWNGYPEDTNAPYGVAKKAMWVYAKACMDQYGLNFIYLIPVNLYGPGDNFNPESSHVIPAMIKTYVDAIKNGTRVVKLWGSGNASREFLYVDDAVDGILGATKKYNEIDPVNLGCGEEITIRDLSTTISRILGYSGSTVWDSSMPDGQPRRQLCIKKAMEKFHFSPRVTLPDGLKRTINWYMGKMA
jgi:GDP-L-fucose synthase